MAIKLGELIVQQELAAFSDVTDQVPEMSIKYQRNCELEAVHPLQRDYMLLKDVDQLEFPPEASNQSLAAPLEASRSAKTNCRIEDSTLRKCTSKPEMGTLICCFLMRNHRHLRSLS